MTIPSFYRGFITELEKLGYSTKGHPDWKTFKKHKVKLTPEERKQVIVAKAVWHHGRGGSPSA